MTRAAAVLCALALASVASGCGDDDSPGPSGTDAGEIDAYAGPIPCEDDTPCVATYCNLGSHLCCAPTDPPYEICGDHIDQDCDHEDESCGDNDRDGIQACRPGEDPIGGCDCDDTRMDVRPIVGSTPGAPEVCDDIDNDCNGRVDESAECCDACSSLGADFMRADVCTVEGVCDCSTDLESGPCATGLTCCGPGCVDTTSDFMNCRFCGAACPGSADRCDASECRCGTDSPCDLDYPCVDGVCQIPTP